MSATPGECLAEFTGTFLLVFTVGCNVLGGSGVWAGTSIACVLMVSIFAFGAISGANFNPAVSVTLGLYGAMDWVKVVIYCVVQLVAGIGAGFGYRALFKKSFNLAPAKNFQLYQAGACEFFYTFMLCFVVLNVAAVRKGCRPYFGLAIGFVIVAGAYGAGAISGGAFNPAVAFGIDVSSYDLGFGNALIYTSWELAGAALAAVLFSVIRPNGGKEDEEYSLVSKCICEFLGTYMLVLTVGLNVNGDGCAWSIAACLMCMIYALGDVSGGNFNPAVSLALIINGALDAATAGAYMAVQVLGGVLGAITYTGICNGQSFPIGPKKGYEMIQAAVGEGVFTFILCLVVLCVAVNEKTNSPAFFALAIGSCVTVGGNAIGNVSGGSLNPAVSFGIATPRLIKGETNSITGACIYTLAEFLGASAAAALVMVTHASVDDKAEAEPIVKEQEAQQDVVGDKA